jgi:hypothetical protein
MSHDIPPNPALGAPLSRLARGYSLSEGDRIAVPRLESPLSSLNRPAHMVVRMSICSYALLLGGLLHWSAATICTYRSPPLFTMKHHPQQARAATAIATKPFGNVGL